MKSLIVSLIMLLSGGCSVNSRERAFLARYEFEDFSQFKGVNLFFRDQNTIFINAPHLVNDTGRVGLYVVVLDKRNSRIAKTKWTLTEHGVNADTIRLQQLAKEFMRYKIPRLNVDSGENVFVYLADVETLAYVRFVNEDELKEYPDRNWVEIKSKWYRAK